MDEITPGDDSRPEEGILPSPTVWPPPPTGVAPTMPGPVPPVFLPVRRLARAVVILLGVLAGLSVLGFGGALIALPQATRQMAVGIVALVQVPLLLATGVCFLIWMYCMERNLRAFGVEGLQYTPIWAVASFFIPIMCLYRPVQILCEIWQASDPAASHGQAWQKVKAPIILGIWWMSFLLMNIADGLSAESPGTTDVDAVDSALGFVTALLALWMVRLFTARQEKTAGVLSLTA